MRRVLFLNFLIWSSAALATPTQELDQLFNNLDNSPTFSIWHAQKEKIETQGYAIWNAHKDSADFCSSLADSGISETGAYTLQAWSYSSRGKCRKEIDWLVQLHKSERLAKNIFVNSVFLESFGIEICDRSRMYQESLGPTREVILDTTGGPKMVRGDLDRCEVAFTFDDGPHPSLTQELVQILYTENIRANFFTVGRNVDRYPDIVEGVAASGHLVGNHSYSHKNFPKIKYSEAKQEIDRGFGSLLKIWDFVSPFFRFPYGAFTKDTRAYIQKHDVAEFFWNMDTQDWKWKDRQKLLSRIASEVNREKKGILLFHDVQPQTIEVMPDVLLALKRAGYRTALFLPKEVIEGEFPD